MATKKRRSSDRKKAQAAGKVRHKDVSKGLRIDASTVITAKDQRPPLTIEQRKLKGKERPIRIADSLAHKASLVDRRPPVLNPNGKRGGNPPTAEGTQDAVTERMEERKKLFLETYRDLTVSYGTIFWACEYLKSLGEVGISRRRVSQWRQEDPEFNKAFIEAGQDVDDQIDSEAVRRATQGWDEPVFGSLGEGLGSGEVGTVRKFSDPLLIDIRRTRRQVLGNSRPKGDSLPIDEPPVSSELTDTDRIEALNTLLESVRTRLAGQGVNGPEEMGSDK